MLAQIAADTEVIREIPGMLEQMLIDWGVPKDSAGWLTIAGGLTVTILLAVVANFIAKFILIKVVHRFVKLSKTDWDDVLLKRRVFHRFSHLVPAIVIFALAPIVMEGHAAAEIVMQDFAYIYLVVIGVLIIDGFLNGVVDIYNRFDVSRKLPIRGFMQVAKLIVTIVAGIAILTIIIGKSALPLLGSLGAFTAILMLVFKDAILGFVAGIQLTANNMIHIGDWIEMPKYGADGDIIDISLTTVKVQNWDKTISTIPAYALISDSFKNWRGMTEADGRRIKRSVCIDTNSIKFCDEKMLEKFKKFQHIADYIAQKEKDIASWNTENGVDDTQLVNGRRMTNIGILRAYITEYLRNHPMLNKDMTMMVRQLEPTPQGMPLQIYTFCTDKRWVYYEGIQSDIFDHILAVIPQFELRAFQIPAGADFNSKFYIEKQQ
jgi:miniconductance mechanosensitive channel